MQKFHRTRNDALPRLNCGRSCKFIRIMFTNIEIRKQSSNESSEYAISTNEVSELKKIPPIPENRPRFPPVLNSYTFHRVAK